MRNLHPSVIEAKIAKLALSLDLDPTPLSPARTLTSKDATRHTSHPLIDLGGHAVRHPCISRLTIAEQRLEIEKFRRSEFIGAFRQVDYGSGPFEVQVAHGLLSDYDFN